MLSINRTGGAMVSHEPEVSPPQPGLAAAAASISASPASVTAASPPLDMTGDDATAVDLLMAFAGNPRGITAAYLSRQGAGAVPDEDVVMQDDGPVGVQPATARGSSEATTMAAAALAPSPSVATSRLREALNNGPAGHPAGQAAAVPPTNTVFGSCSDFISHIRQNGNLREGSRLTLRNVDDHGLALFAETMKSTQHPAIHLGLNRNGYSFTAAGLKAIAPLKLLTLSLYDAAFFPRDHEALEGVSYHISLSLAKPTVFVQVIPGLGSHSIVERTPHLQAAVSLSTLYDLTIQDHQVSHLELLAVSRHPNLRSVTATVPVPKLFSALLSNPRITEVKLHSTEWDKMGFDFDRPNSIGLSEHPALQHLSIRDATSAELVLGIARNRKIDTLKLGISGAATVGVLRHLAAMPALRILSLQSIGGELVTQQADLIALCQKPLYVLHLLNFTMDAHAVSAVVRARVRDLALVGKNMIISSADITALCENDKLRSLVLGVPILPADAARLAAVPRLTTLGFVQTPGAESAAIKFSAQQAWVAARKPPLQLRFIEG